MRSDETTKDCGEYALLRGDDYECYFASFKDGYLNNSLHTGRFDDSASIDEYRRIGNTVVHVLLLRGRTKIQLSSGCEIVVVRVQEGSVGLHSPDGKVVSIAYDNLFHIHIEEECTLEVSGVVTLIVRVPVY